MIFLYKANNSTNEEGQYYQDNEGNGTLEQSSHERRSEQVRLDI